MPSKTTTPAPKPSRKPKLTDAERHRRFVELAKKVGASEDITDFDRAFEMVVRGHHEPRDVRRREEDGSGNA